MVDDSTNRIPAGFVMEYMKLAYVGTDGLQLGEPVVWLTNTPGGGATSYVPQVSTVITLDSGKWRDPGKYSRYYLPAAAPGSGNYKLTSLMTQAIATAQGNFIGALNDAVVAPYENVPAGGDYVYDAQVSAVSSAGTGQDNTIQTVRVGDIYDTQRRRRNALTETYSTAEVP